VEYLVLARRYRPQTFDEIVGQEHVSRTLKNAIREGRVAHAYLFTGPRGVGKTSTARILAKALNCERGPTTDPCGACGFCADIASGRSLDVVEIDGASNRGIDEIRDLRENARYVASPGKKRIYIVDEVHMLTNEAWNALLKILEEPPPHVLFIFATTQPSKVLPTILSRCQRFDFRRIPTEQIVGRLRSISQKESFGVAEDVLYLVARRADGGLRDAESLLDQVVSFAGKGATRADAEEVLGVVGEEVFAELAAAIQARDAGRAAGTLARAIDSGADLVELAGGFLEHLRALFIAAVAESPGEVLDASPEAVERLQEAARPFAPADLLRLARILSEAEREMRRSAQPRVLLEMALFEMASIESAVELEELIARLDAATGAGAGGGAAAASAPPGERTARAPGARTAPAESAPRVAPAPPRPPPPLRAQSSAAAPLAAPALHARAAAAEPSTPMPPSATDDAARWTAVVRAVSESKRTLGAFLGRARLVEIAGGRAVLELAASDAFHRDEILRPDNRALIEQEILREFGVACRLDAVTAGGAPAARGLLDHPGVRRALSFFDAEVVTRRAGQAADAGPPGPDDLDSSDLAPDGAA
jgi:DNA polymerase-3 subunit gamma/tau